MIRRSGFVDTRERQCTGKRQFRTKAHAKKFRRRAPHLNHGDLDIYRCPWCSAYHIGHKPDRKAADGE